MAKLMLNSLYGRFGMEQSPNKIEIVDKETFENIAKSHLITTINSIPNSNLELIRYSESPNVDVCNDSHPTFGGVLGGGLRKSTEGWGESAPNKEEPIRGEAVR